MSPTITTFAKSKGFMSADSFCLFAARCTGLVHLSLRSCVLTPVIIQAMGTHLQHLKSLDVSKSESVTDDILRTLAVSCGDRLTELLVVQCGELSLRGMQQVLPMFTKLTTFGFKFNALEDRPIFDFTLLSRITTLSIFYATENDGRFLTQIPLHCPNLQHFCFQWRAKVLEGEELDALVTNCTLLRTLRVECGSDVEKHMPRWRSLRPGLKVKNVLFDMQEGLQAVHNACGW